MLIAKALFGWVALWFITINLLGWALRSGSYSPATIDAPTDRVSELLEREGNRMRFGGTIWNLLGVAALGLFLWTLYQQWNIWILAAAAMIVVGRLPDLLWEMRSGLRVTPANCPKGVLYRGAVVLVWLALPLVWFGLKVATSAQ